MELRQSWKTTLWLATVLLAAVAAEAQLFLRVTDEALWLEGGPIRVNGVISDYNQFDSSPGGSLSGDMNTNGDVFVQFDIELGGELYCNQQIFLQRDPAGPSGDQLIYFADDGSRADEFIFWDDSEDVFALSDDVSLLGTRKLEATGELNLSAEAPLMRFVVDSDNDADTASQNHVFVWARDSTASGDRIMQLQSDLADDGDLFLDGQLTQNHAFDLAESFWQSEPLEAGELVSVDPERADAVRRSSGAYDRLVIGVVSTRPAIVMGGGAFSVEDLRRTWGDAVADALERQRPDLEARVYEASPGLRAERDRLYSAATWGDHLALQMADKLPDPGPADEEEERHEGGARTERARLSEREVAASHRQAQISHAMRVADLVMQRFFDERFAAVALAGRVPVKVDASFGAIEPGDRLTASHTPGVAMKAERSGPVIGTALEAMTTGEGTILALVHSGWHRPEADRALSSLRRDNHRKDNEIAALRRSNLALERRVEALELAVRAVAAATPTPELAPALASKPGLARDTALALGEGSGRHETTSPWPVRGSQ